MRTVKSIQSAETFLRKLAGVPSNFSIRTMHSTVLLNSGRCVCGSSYRIKITTEDKIECDSGALPTLQLAVDRVAESITTERVRMAGKRNSEAVKRLALLRPEVQR